MCMVVGVHVTEPSPYGRDVKAGPIFTTDGDFALLALRDVAYGEEHPTDAFVHPDFSRPKIGETGTFAAAFWHGLFDFTQPVEAIADA